MSSSTSSSEQGPIQLLLRMLPFGIALLALMLACWCWGPHVSRVDYLAGLHAKHQRLASVPAPRTILIGGSNVTFGMDSPLLEQALCKPVVNMTIHASLGLQFMVDEVKDELQPGDVVIAPLEFSTYSAPIKDNDIHLLAIDFDPSLMRYIPWYLRPKVMAGILVMRVQAVWKVFSGAWKNAEPHAYFRADGFNEQGDLISHLGRAPWPAEKQEPVSYQPTAVDPTFWHVIGELKKTVDDAQATLIITWPCIAEGSFRPLRADSVRTLLAAHGYELLGQPQDYVQADTAFYDTHYHLRATGRTSRTVKLIKDLCGSGAVECCREGAN